MTDNGLLNWIKKEEFDGEKLISKFRLVIAVIYSISVIFCSVINNADGYNFFPARAYICSNLNTLYSVIIFFYLRRVNSVHRLFKYFCVAFDMLVISASVWVGCTYIEICPPVTYLSIWALFFFVLILIGSFRYSVRCAVFSGIFAGLCYFAVVFINRQTIELPYFILLEDKQIRVSFPVLNEAFRALSMVVTGMITGMACKRHLNLLGIVKQSQSDAADTVSATAEKTRNMSKTIRKSTDEIFLSSKDIFTTANNQAASVQEIESTINENTIIAGEIAKKTSSVAAIASKMENDVNQGFSVLERNVEQIKNIKSKNDGVISGIIALGNKITKIRDIVKAIKTITNQTKVIAFNAGLEAAGAGEKGKRFSVVASEVNRLADDIASLTRQIHEQVEEIQSSSSSLIISSEESAEKIIEGNNLIKELEDIFREIHNGAEITANQAQTITVSTQKQQKSIEQINTAIKEISKGLSSFIQSTRASSSSASDLADLINELDTLLTVNPEDKDIETAEDSAAGKSWQ